MCKIKQKYVSKSKSMENNRREESPMSKNIIVKMRKHKKNAKRGKDAKRNGIFISLDEA